MLATESKGRLGSRGRDGQVTRLRGGERSAHVQTQFDAGTDPERPMDRRIDLLANQTDAPPPAHCARCGTDVTTAWAYCEGCGGWVRIEELAAALTPTGTMTEEEPPSRNGLASISVVLAVLAALAFLCIVALGPS
jgi:hypothetical protein